LSRLEQPPLWRAILTAMLVPMALVAFWPTPVDKPVSGELAAFLAVIHSLGFPRWINYAFVEATANVVLFVPLGAVASQAFPNKRWWQAAAFGLLVSGFMELGQELFLHDRFASPLDVVTNTTGSVIGVLVIRAAVQLIKRRQAQRLSALSLFKTGL
jgi:glycopeptide antibiotics resistance protein